MVNDIERDEVVENCIVEELPIEELEKYTEVFEEHVIICEKECKQENEMDESIVSISLELNGESVALVTEYDRLTTKKQKWSTYIVFNEDTTASRKHEKPIFDAEGARDEWFANQIRSHFEEIPLKEASKFVNKFLNKAVSYKNEIVKLAADPEKDPEYLRTQLEKEQNELAEAIRRKKAFEDKCKYYGNVLQNVSGTCTDEEIEDAKTQLKNLLMFSFWHPKISKDGEVTVVLNKLEIAKYVKKAHNLIRTGLRIWRYDWKDACYKYDKEDEIINQLVVQIMFEVGDGHQYNGNVVQEKKGIIDAASNIEVYTDSPFNKYKGLINTKNGVIKLDYENKTATLIGKKPEYMFNYCIDTIYNPNADSEPIDTFIEQIVGPEQKEFIYQILAIAIRDADAELETSRVIYFLQGPPGAGKNMLLKLMTLFLGYLNVSNIPLHVLVEDRYIKASLEGKLLNVNDEVSSCLPMKESREIKTLTGGKVHQLNPKGIQSYNGIITAIHVFAGNHLPKCDIPKSDKAFWGRWEIINCPNQFKVNEHLGEQIFTQENMSGLLNKVIEKLIDIHNNGIKRLCPSYEETYNRWKLSSDSVYRFMTEMLEPSITPQTYTEQYFFQKYIDFCENPIYEIDREDIRREKSKFIREAVAEFKTNYKIAKSHSNREYRIELYAKFRDEKSMHAPDYKPVYVYSQGSFDEPPGMVLHEGPEDWWDGN